MKVKFTSFKSIQIKKEEENKIGKGRSWEFMRMLEKAEKFVHFNNLSGQFENEQICIMDLLL